MSSSGNSVLAAFKVGQQKRPRKESNLPPLIKKSKPMDPSTDSSKGVDVISSNSANHSKILPPVVEIPPPKEVRNVSSVDPPSAHILEKGGSNSTQVNIIEIGNQSPVSKIVSRRDRRELRSESLPGHRLIFPSLDKPSPFYKIYKNDPNLRTALKGDDFRVYPGLVDTDSIQHRGVASRLMISSILPRDEEMYCGDMLDNIDVAERRLVEGTQRASLALGYARSLQIKGEELNAKLVEADRIINELKKKLHNLDQCNKEVICDNKKLQERNKELQECHKKLQEQFDSQVLKCKELKKGNALLLSHHKNIDEKIKVARAAAVREYRESKECYARKCAVGVSFSKIGFYLARQILEKEHGRDFPELVFSKTESITDLRPWKSFDPDEDDSVTSTNNALFDDLDNLNGPWEFFGKNGVDVPLEDIPQDDRISALQGLDDDHGVEDEPPTNDVSNLPSALTS